ncbi:MAG: heavy metal translocating P-type ATPase [Rhodospirillales bacterium]|nr:heavy metal translocating P-type ATPase [Rhodospirillales bacterium]
MDCAACVASVEKAVQRLPGVASVEVNLMAERMTLRGGVGFDPGSVERQVASLGYSTARNDGAAAPGGGKADGHAHDHDHSHDHSSGHRHEGAAVAGHTHGDAGPAGQPWWATGKARLTFLLGGLVGAAFALSQVAPALQYWFYLAAALVALAPFGRRAIALARAGSPFSIETLMCVAALGAIAIGAAEEAAVVVFLFALGELLEGVAAGRARAGIRALGKLLPRQARREGVGGAIEEVAIERLAVGDVVQVRPGDRLPGDGVILEGQSAIDESPVTGESVPVARGVGDAVVAGSINTDGVLRVRVTRRAADNTIARIMRMVEEAAASRAPTQRFIERFAEIWTPGAMAVAAVVILAPPLLFGAEWGVWIYRGLALLLVACPCALVISVPAAMASGLSAGARRGLLIKGGAALGAIGAARMAAFDKTGTLTAGHPVVTDLLPAAGVDEAELLAQAAAVEQGSAHPLARAILAEAARRGIAVPAAEAGGAAAGKAVFATLQGRRIAVGSPRWAEEEGVALPPGLAALEDAGKTVVVVAGAELVGVIALRDEPRPDAASGLAALRALGVRSVMLTGDNARTGRAIGAALGIEVQAELLPEDKLREITRLRGLGPVAMVGDGINDAPSLAAATVGIAMDGGTDVALEAADAALLNGRVGGVADLVALSRATLGNVRQNVAIAVGLKLLFVLTTVTGATTLWMAILADTGATVLVTLNALRLLGWQPPRQSPPRQSSPVRSAEHT